VLPAGRALDAVVSNLPDSRDQRHTKARLEVLDGPSKGLTLELNGRGIFALGRGRGNDLRIRQREVSRKHCTVQCDGEHFWLVDAGSVNGTLVNDEKVHRYMLYDGDVIKVGGSTIVFRLLDAAAGP